MDIADMKKELSSDEKVLESAFKLETIYKKHKVKVWLLVVVVVGSLFGNIILEKMENDKLIAANSAFLKLQSDPSDSSALNTMQSNNPKLYDLYMYSVAVQKEDKELLSKLQHSSNSIVSDASRYTLGAIDEKSTDSKLYKEFSIISNAYTSIKNGDFKTANSQLELIDARSPLGVVSTYLKHSTIKGQ